MLAQGCQLVLQLAHLLLQLQVLLILCSLDFIQLLLDPGNLFRSNRRG